MERSAESPDRPVVVAVVGSPRAAGNTSYLVDVALDELARRGLVVEKIMLGEYRVLPCEGHDECEDLAACPLDDDAGTILERMYGADGLILATPVYYEDVSGQMKIFIDRNCFNNYHEIWLRARSVGLIAVAESTGLDETIDSLRRPRSRRAAPQPWRAPLHVPPRPASRSRRRRLRGRRGPSPTAA